MSTLKFGERIGRNGVLRPGASALIFDESRERILLTQREDNGRWCLPGGGMDPGESAPEACAREVLEETGLVVRVGRLVGVYTTPNLIVQYADGNRFQPVALNFEAEPIGGKLTLSNETTETGYFSMDEMKSIDVMEHHLERIKDALAETPAAIVR